MKKYLSILLLCICLFECSCATFFGGEITDCQKRRNNKSRQIRPVALMSDLIFGMFLFEINTLVDFMDGAMYKPCLNNVEHNPIIENYSNRTTDYNNKIINNCNGIKKEYDKFKNETKFRTMRLNSCFSFLKIISANGDTSIYMELNVRGSIYSPLKSGVILLLSDKRKIELPNERIDVDSDTDGYMYNCFIRLSEDQIDEIRNSYITAFRLYIYDKDMSMDEQEKLNKQLNCIINAM